IIDITTKVGLALKTVGLFNIQYIVDQNEEVYIIEVNPRASRSIPFISKVTNINVSAIATKVILNHTLAMQKIKPGLLKPKRDKYYVKTPTFSFSKIKGLDTNLGPEMKSTGEAIGYDTTLNKALYKALQASGMKIKDYGTVFITVADEDKKEVVAIASKFYDLGFNIVATKKTQEYLIKHGIKAKLLPKINEGSDIILEWIRKDYIKYIVNTQSSDAISHDQQSDGYLIRTNAALNNITTFTSLDTVKVLLEVLEERGIKVATI
ncbi:MAG: carbamoyl-phosphate synthase large subunit, partial [Bacilli bacterium]